MQNYVCSVCRTKNDTNSLHQLNMIVRNLERVIGSQECDQHEVEDILHRFGGRYEMFESGLHCRYGLHCPTLDRMRADMRRQADIVPELIVKAVLVDASSVQPILRMMGGYFPRAYRFTENVLGYMRCKNAS